MVRLVTIVALCAALLAGFSWFSMYRKAEKFNATIQNEILGPFDRRAGLDSVNDAVMTLARDHRINLSPDSVNTRIVSQDDLRAASATGISVPGSVREAIEVKTTFTIDQFVFSRTFTRTARRHLHGESPGSHSPGFGGVNLPGPGRDVHSHRQTIERATGGRTQ